MVLTMIDSSDLWSSFCDALAKQLKAAKHEDLRKAWSTHAERTAYYRKLLHRVATDLELDFRNELFTVDFVMWTRSDPPIPIVFIESENFAFTAHHEVRKLSCISAPLRVLMAPIQWDESPGVWPNAGLRRHLLDQWRTIVRSYQETWSRSGIFALVIGEWRPDNVLRFYANAFDGTGDLVSKDDRVLVEIPMKEGPTEFKRRILDDLPRIVLAVLDDVGLRKQVSDVCDKNHYTFVAATSSSEATKLMRQIVPSVIILKLGMGESEVVQWQRNHHLASSLLIVRSNSDDAIEAIKMGATDYLVEPLTNDQLQSVIESALLINRTKAYDFAAFDQKNR
jgi:CheY-like chemotaxis protein